MAGLWAATFAAGIAGGGCVLYAVDDNEPCGVQAVRINGMCECLSGYEGDPETVCDPIMTFLITDACDDGLDLEWRAFALDRDWIWPGASEVFVTPGFDVDAHQKIACIRDETVCIGAAAGEVEWGLGLDGPQAAQSCGDCCYTCGPWEVDLGLYTCG